VLEYFTRRTAPVKGLADTALKTANSGYRRAVWSTWRRIASSRRSIAVPRAGIAVRAIIDSGTVVASLASRILGRTTAEDVKDPTGTVSSASATRCSARKRSRRLCRPTCRSLRIRFVLTCELTNGVAALCYGRDLARGTPVNMARRSCDRGAVDRRAGHPAHHAHVPHRRRAQISDSRSSSRTSTARS